MPLPFIRSLVLCISRLLLYSIWSRHVLQTAGGMGWNTGYQRLTQRHSADVSLLCAFLSSDICSSKHLVSAHERHCLDAEPARATCTCGTQCNHKYFKRCGRQKFKYCMTAFPSHWECSRHFQLLFLLHICLSTRRKVLELLLKRNE